MPRTDDASEATDDSALDRPTLVAPFPDPGSVERPRALGWLYGLIALSLISVGVAAGNLLFTGVRALENPWAQALTQCMRDADAQAVFGSTAGVDPTGNVDFIGYAACMADQNRVKGLVLLAGGLLVLAGGTAMLFGVPIVDRRRLRRHPGRDYPAAQARFDELCRRQAVTPPGLRVAGPSIRHAFTTAVPGRRPTIVVPTRLAIRPDETFDAIVSHELAHVVARDVTWVSAFRGPLWLFLPVLLLAGLPELLAYGFSPVPVTAMIEAMLLVTALVILATALLRLREHEADRYAAATGSGATLLAMFEQAAAAAPADRSAWGRVRRLLARHPTPADRAAALRRGVPTYEGGFGQALAVGFVALMAMGAVSSVLAAFSVEWVGWQLSAPASIVGAAVLGLLTPSLVRRARRPGDARWWRPLTGVALGIVLGAFVSPVVTRPGQIAFPALSEPWFGYRAVAAVALVALFATGVVAVAISLARSAAASRVSVRLVTIVSVFTAIAGLWPVGSLASVLQRPDDLRRWFEFLLPRQPWPLLGVALVLGYALIARRSRSASSTPGGSATRPRIRWVVAGAAAVVGGGAGVMATVTSTATSLDDLVRLQQQRWWICFAAGAVVLIVLASARPGPRAWADAFLAGLATALVTATVQLLHAVLDGRATGLSDVRLHLAAPAVWLFYQSVVLAPVLAIRSAPTPLVTGPTMAGPHNGPALDGSRRRMRLKRIGLGWLGLGWLGLGFASAVVTALAVVLVLTVGVPGGFAPLPAAAVDPSSGVSRPEATVPETAVSGGASPTPSAPPRVLTPTQAQFVADAGAQVLPNYWQVEPPETDPDSAAISPSSCEPLARDEFLSTGETAKRATATARFTTRRGPVGVVYLALTMTVLSYDTPVGEALIAAAERARAACPAFTGSSGSFSVDFVVTAGAVPAVGERAWRYDSSMRADGLTGSNAMVIVSVGTTVIVAYMAATMEPLDEQLLTRVLDTSVRASLDPP